MGPSRPDKLNHDEQWKSVQPFFVGRLSLTVFVRPEGTLPHE